MESVAVCSAEAYAEGKSEIVMGEAIKVREHAHVLI